MYQYIPADRDDLNHNVNKVANTIPASNEPMRNPYHKEDDL